MEECIMDIQTIKLFAKYNTDTNRKMNDIIIELTKEQWEKEFGGFFKSIQAICNHVYIGDFNWLMRFSNLRRFNYVQDTLFQKNIRFDEMVIGTVQKYNSMRDILDKEINNFVNELSDDDLAKDLRYLDSRGNEFRKNFGGLIISMFNHQTHHRGMISIYLEQLGVANDYSNLTAVL
jgi:uncharacterized damage-inducible protein DinB